MIIRQAKDSICLNVRKHKSGEAASTELHSVCEGWEDRPPDHVCPEAVKRQPRQGGQTAETDGRTREGTEGLK